jgi:hypothetical protein
MELRREEDDEWAKRLLDDQQYLVDKANSDLAEFDSQPAMVSYEAQRLKIFNETDEGLLSAELSRLDAQHHELLRQRNDLLSQRVREEIILQELKDRARS